MPFAPTGDQAHQMAALARSARQLFAEEVRRPEPEIGLARAALLIAKEQYPQLSVDHYLARLDQLAEEVKDRLAEETAPLVVLGELIRVLYERHDFRGNKDAYYDPRNSFLNDVIDRGLGIPLTLGIVLLEVGWRLELPLQGVNFPHHFLVRYRGEGLDLLIDPFDGGQLRFEDQAQEFLDRVYGGMVRVQDSFLRRATRREMLGRLLRNLKSLYINTHDYDHALSIVERLLVLHPEAPDEHRSRAILLMRLGRGPEAAAELEAYLGLAPEAADARRIAGMLRRLRRGELPDLDEEGPPDGEPGA